MPLGEITITIDPYNLALFVGAVLLFDTLPRCLGWALGGLAVRAQRKRRASEPTPASAP